MKKKKKMDHIEDREKIGFQRWEEKSDRIENLESNRVKNIESGPIFTRISDKVVLISKLGIQSLVFHKVPPTNIPNLFSRLPRLYLTCHS